MAVEDAIINALTFAPEKTIGPVAAAFYYDNHEISAIMGPVGSAKTSTAMMKVFRHALLQEPNERGIRYYKHTIIRDTYRNLNKTTIPSWLRWIPKDLGTWRGGGSAEPATHNLKFKLSHDGTFVDLQVDFIAMGDANAENALKGLETTSIHINEADLVSEDVMSFGAGRTGRFPSGPFGRCSWKGIWSDLNAPQEDNYMADKFIFNKPESFAFFRQPSGESPEAENLQNLPGGAKYYLAQKDVLAPDLYRRLVLNEIGYSRSGEPVYEEYNDDVHTAKKELSPVPGIPLRLGADAGLTPACTIGQRLPDGQFIVLREIVSTGIGVYKFAEAINKILSEEFSGFSVASAAADPAAAAKSSTDRDEKSWLQILRNETGINWQPAPTNNITPRLAAVKGMLTRLIDGKPGLLVSPACKILRRGFISGYCLKDGEPMKNEYSHVHDSFQYNALMSGEYFEVMNRQKRFKDLGKTFVADTNFGVFSNGC